jgi:anti-anti-sigma factor
MTVDALNRYDMSFPAGAISEELVADRIVSLELRGEIDLALEGELRLRALNALDRDCHVIADLSEATFVDASVIGALLSIQREAETRGAVLALQMGTAEIVERVITLTGIENVIWRGRTREEVVRFIAAQNGH